MSVEFETLRERREEAVLFAEISAPPMNLLVTELGLILARAERVRRKKLFRP